MTWPFGSMQMFGYDVIVADPPWDFRTYSQEGQKKGAGSHYNVMSWVNAKIPTDSEIRAEHYRNSVEKERDFWLKKAEQLQIEMENIFDHAKEHGKIELHHRGEKLVLTVQK